MLTQEQLLSNKQRYIELLTKLNIDVSFVTQYLDGKRADYFNKPYNLQPRAAYQGSLCEHALKLYDELTKLRNIYCPNNYSETDLIIVALFRDIYRAELYESYNKNLKNEATGQWESKLSYREKEIRPIFGDVYFSSYMIARKFIDLTNDELVETICYSNLNGNIDIHNIRRDYKLVSLLTMAEFAVNYLGE